MRSAISDDPFAKLGDPERALQQLDRELSEESLVGFIEASWHVLEPTRQFVPGWHIDAICEHLEAVASRDITRLLINVPPGCMKSMTTDVFFPAWLWGPQNEPDLRFVSWSYSVDIPKRDNRKARTLIQSDWYQNLWGDRFHLVKDQNQKTRFENNWTGVKLASSFGGLGTGERGDHLIVDDPHNVKDGESDKVRNETLLWFRETLTSRLNDQENSTITVIMQRVHEEDVSGMILAKELGYEHLCLPMEFEPERKCYVEVTGFEDPRTEENELLWSEKMPRHVVERDKIALGPYATAGQYQQRPSPRGGGRFKREWFEVVDAAPATGVVCRGWDLAMSEGEDADWTAGLKLRMTPGGVLYIEHGIRWKATPGKNEQLIKNVLSQDGFGVVHSLPQDPAQAGKAQVSHLSRSFHGYDVHFSLESGDKETRANPVAAQAEAGNIKIVKGSWNEEFFDEVTVFPNGKFDDQVDALSRAYYYLISVLVPQLDDVPYAPEVIY